MIVSVTTLRHVVGLVAEVVAAVAVVYLFGRMMMMKLYVVKRNYSDDHLVARVVLVKLSAAAVVEGNVKVVAQHVVKVAVDLLTMNSQLKN